MSDLHFDVFLSYQSSDLAAAREINERLEREGLVVWFDENIIRGGDQPHRAMTQGITESRVGVILLGQGSQGAWHEQEMQALVRAAVQSGKRVIPVLLPGAPDVPRDPFIANFHWVDLRSGYDGKGFRDLLLAIRNSLPGSSEPVAADLDHAPVPPSETAEYLHVHQLDNPLKGDYLHLVEDFAREFTEGHFATNSDLGERTIECIRSASKAELVFVLIEKGRQLQVEVRASNYKSPSTSQNYFESDKELAVRAISNQDEHIRPAHNIRFSREPSVGESGEIVVVPIFDERSTQRYLVIAYRTEQSKSLDDFHCYILSACYKAAYRAPSFTRHFLKGIIFDYLKKDYFRRLPVGVYEARYTLFEERLSEMEIFFQPVISLRNEHVSIFGWEALARDKQTKDVAEDIFDAAEVWGRKFKTILDQMLTDLSVTQYGKALIDINRRRGPERRGGDIIDWRLFVNVYPDSLMQDGYAQLVLQRLRENKQIKKVVFEISEKEQVGKHFRSTLKPFVGNPDISIEFAIDDFGVGHSSFLRLAQLQPTFLKLDREMLRMDANTSEEIVSSAADIAVALNPAHRTQVIVEGLDDKSNVELANLYRRGIRYVQGYSIGKPSPELYWLDDKKKEQLEDQLRKNKGLPNNDRA